MFNVQRLEENENLLATRFARRTQTIKTDVIIFLRPTLAGKKDVMACGQEELILRGVEGQGLDVQCSTFNVQGSMFRKEKSGVRGQGSGKTKKSLGIG